MAKNANIDHLYTFVPTLLAQHFEKTNTFKTVNMTIKISATINAYNNLVKSQNPFPLFGLGML
jgi:hypothetical protein